MIDHVDETENTTDVSENNAETNDDSVATTTESAEKVTTEAVAEPAPAAKPAAKEAKKSAADKDKPKRELSEAQRALPWYVVHTYSGFESFAKKSLEERIRTKGLSEQFGDIIVPQETVVELVRGVKKTSTKKFFPGYILIQTNLNEDTWHLVKETPKVTGFVGDSREPLPLTQDEVKNLTAQIEGGPQKPRSRVQYEIGDMIKVVDGPFTDFNGTVDEVKPDKGKLRVLISIFGRNTPVELDFVQVEKA
ncbi:transcription termination/antitermination protein NusG [bacterium]|nr:transcription termination/antitermination protein NusG [bacterium]